LHVRLDKDRVQQLIYTVQQDRPWLLVVGPTFHSCLHLWEAAKWCSSLLLTATLSTCIFCQNFMDPHFHNLELLVRYRCCEFIWASLQTCAFTWSQTHCDVFFNLLVGEFSSQAAWLMLCCHIRVDR